jgi:hypothetical protein
MEINRQAATKLTTINASKQRKSNRTTHEASMVAHLSQHAMATTLAAGATTEEEIAVGHAASGVILGEGGSAPMQDYLQSDTTVQDRARSNTRPEERYA